MADNASLRFNFFSASLENYSGESANPSQLLKTTVKELTHDKIRPEHREIDRFKNRSKKKNDKRPERKLILVVLRFTPGGLRAVGRFALVKAKAPFLHKQGESMVREIENPDNRRFVELTHLLIDFSTTEPTVMIEFNSAGPRASDIEFYLKQISVYHKIAKKLTFKPHLDLDYKSLENKMINVFGIDVKVNALEPGTISKGNWATALRTLQEETGHKEIRIETFFRHQKAADGSYEHNPRGTTFARNLIDWFRGSANRRKVKEFKLRYESADNPGEIEKIDLLKHKQEVVIEIDLLPNGSYDRQKLEQLMLVSINDYLN